MSDPKTDTALALTPAQLHLARQWFDCVQDVNPAYLGPADCQLARAIYEALAMRVPDSLLEKVNA